jgi:hypothetical protein
MNRKSINLICCIVILIIFITHLVNAQDANYWIHQYGTRADLLSGLVVGGVKDLSSIYYNPGAVPLAPEQSLVINANAFEFSRIVAQDGAGTGKDLISSQSGNAPGIFAVRISSSKSIKNHWVISYLTRHDFKLEVDGRRIDDRSSTDNDPTAQDFSGEIIVIRRLNEGWGGLTYGRNIGKKTAFGITQFISYRSQQGRDQAIGQLVNRSGQGAAAIAFDGYDYYNVRTLWKMGIAFDYRPISFGFAFTTPSISLFGNGSTVNNFSLIVPDSSGSILASNYQEDLAAIYRSPMSISAGLNYRFRQSSLYFTIEWFNRVDEFSVLEPSDFIAQTSGRILSQDYKHELKSVTNFGLGIQHTFHERLSLYGSFITDRSAKIEGSDSHFATSNWDIYHLTAGTALTYGRLDLTLGLTYSYGRNQFDRGVNFNEATSSSVFKNPIDLQNIIYQRIKVIIGFSFLSPDQSED